MKPEEIATFPILKKRRDKCHLKKRYNEYYVQKEVAGDIRYHTGDRRYRTTNTYFWATLSKTFIPDKPKHLSPTRAYLDQVGYIQCVRGEIHQIWVNEKPINARDCGIATVLTRLCMVDPDLTKVRGSRNFGIDLIDDEKTRTWMLTGAEYFIALQMSANPVKGAYAYFSAAKKSGLTIFMTKGSRSCLGVDYLIADTKMAEKAFNKNTGEIDVGSCKVPTRHDRKPCYCKVGGMHSYFYFFKPRVEVTNL